MATHSNPTAPLKHSVEASAGGGVSSPNSQGSTASHVDAIPINVAAGVVSPSFNYLAAAGGSSNLGSGEDVEAQSQPESYGNSGGGGNAGKKPVWNKPSSEVVAEGSPAISVASWPALSKSTSKMVFSDSLKNLPQGSTPVSQVPPPQSSLPVAAHGDTGKTGNSPVVSSSTESSRREGRQRGGFGSQSHSGSEYHQQRNSFRRGNGGPHPRGNGLNHHNFGGRRDQDRGNQDWNPHRNFSGRDAHMQPHRGPSRPFIRGPPHASMPYLPPPIPGQPPFATPMIYPDVPYPVFYFPGAHQDPFRAMPMLAPMAPMFIPFADPEFQMKIVNQINFYFSDENLVKDIYLRRNMDEQGWVPIKLIAGFRKVSQLTDDIQVILSALQFSNVVEVEGEKVRRQNDWSKWIIPSSAQHSTGSSPQSLRNSVHDMLSTQLQI